MPLANVFAQQPTGLSDEELFAPPQQAHTLAPVPLKPVAAPAPMPAPAPVGLSDADLFGGAPAPTSSSVVPEPPASTLPGLWDRFTANASHSFNHGTITGGVANVFDASNQDQIVRNLREQGQTEAADRYQRGIAAANAQRQQDYEKMPTWNGQGGFLDKAAAGLAALSGEVAGGLASPEGLITRIPGVGSVIERMAPKIVEKVVPKVAAPVTTRIVDAGANQAVVNTVTDPVIQAANIKAGSQAKYDPVQTALAPAFGFLLGGTVHGASELPGGIKGIADTFRAWRDARGSKGAKTAPEAPPTPDEMADFEASPELRAHMAANGITDPADPRIGELETRLAARRQTESVTVTHPRQDAGGSTAQQFHADQQRQADERAAIDQGDMSPGFSSQAGRTPRQPIPDSIPVRPNGQADIGDPAMQAATDKFGGTGGQLVPTEPQPNRMTPDEIARSRAKMEGGNQNTAQPADRFVAPEGRAPQTRDDVASQRQADGAFDMANRQRERVTPNSLDTQAGGRPQGSDQQQVVLDEGFPVQVIARKHVEVNGKTVEMATVHRYDPRTGAKDPEGVEYDVPVRQLRTSNYANEPRRAQDFEVRSKGPRPPENPRMPDQGVTREPKQTYRTGPAEDPNTDFPGSAPEGSSPFPQQPEGPHPGPKRASREDEAIRDFEARQRDQSSYDYRKRQSEPRGEDKKAGPVAKGLDDEGRFHMDDRGFVVSDKAGPIKFADQKQAAKWIINEGHKKSADQIFEIENHPSGNGFTVHERGRADPKPDNEPPPSDGPSSQSGNAPGARGRGEGGSPGALPPPAKPEAPRARMTPEVQAHYKNADADIAAHRNKAGVTKPRGDGSLFDRMRELGGIKEDRGDIGQIMQGYKDDKFKTKVFRPDGLHPDEMRRKLQAEGWFGGEDRHGAGALEAGAYPGDDIKDLHAAMEREAGGDKVYHPADNISGGGDRAYEFQRQQALDEEISRAGITNADNRAQAARKLAEYRASEEARFHAAEDQRKLDEAAEGGLSEQDLEDLRGEGYSRYESDADAWQEEPAGNEGNRSQADDIPGWEEDAGRSDNQAGTSERAAGENADAGQPGEQQTRVDGTEHAADDAELKARADKKAAEEKQANPRAFKDKAQKGHADDGLFGDQSEKNQSDMFADPDQKAGAESLRNKFYSNPLGDPAAWRELGRILGDSFGWAKGEIKAWTEHLENMLHAVPRPDLKGDGRFERAWNATYPMRKWISTLSYSNDGRLRGMAAQFKSGPMREIADMFFAAPRGGKEGAVGRDYFQAVSERRGRWLNELESALEPFQKMKPAEREEALKQVGRLVQNPGSIRAGTPIHDAASEIGRILKEAHTYLREAGVEVGEVKRGYLPRVENTDAILADPEKFKAAAVRAYRADGVPLKEAKAAADNWFNRVMLGDLGIRNDMPDFSNAGGGSNVFTRSRELSKKADEIMGDFFMRNPADIIPAYVNRAVQKAEWSRRLGVRDKDAQPPRGVDRAEWLADPEGKWKDLKQRMIDEGNGEHVPDVVRIIKSITGNMGSRGMISGAGRAATNFARTWSALTYLPRATFASMSEPVNIAIRTGNTLDAGRAYVRTLQHMIPGVRNAAGPKYLRELAKDLGFIGEAIDNLTMLQRVGTEGGGRLSRLIQGQFFKRTGLTQLTEANRMASVQIGMTFIRRLANDVTENTHYSGIARRMLAELGVGPETLKGRNGDPVESFAQWVMALENPKSADILKGGDLGDAYHTALGRFVSQTVMAPTGATRAYFAQHPLGSLIYNLQSFNYAFQKNVLNRITAMTKDAFNPKSGLNMHERAYAMMPLLNVVPLLMVTYGIGEIRDALFKDPARAGRPDMTGGEKWKRTISRAGLTGNLDVPYNALTGARYQRDPLTAGLGPIVGGADLAIGDLLTLASDRNSDNTNTFERKVAKDGYQMFIQPALEAGALMAAPESTALGFTAGTLGIYGASHPRAREKFVRALYGPPAPPKGSAAAGMGAGDFKMDSGFSAKDFK